MELSENYILNALFTYAGTPSYNKYDGVYNCGCPICREGKSWGRKKRLYFYPKTKSLYCFNCSKSWSAINWISEVSGLSFSEIITESKNSFSRELKIDDFSFNQKDIPTLPTDSINLFDESQKKFYSNNETFKKCLDYIKYRRLDVAINRPKSLFISFTDKFHKNRLILPFYNQSGKILYYQTRALNGEMPKYLSKFGSEKTIFGLDKVDPDFEYLFIFEGPIDSMFIKNGIAIAGLSYTDAQKKQLSKFPFHKKIWIIDNIKTTKDKETKDKVLTLLNDSQKVFKWTNDYKDLNEWCVSEKLYEINPEIILNNLYAG